MPRLNGSGASSDDGGWQAEVQSLAASLRSSQDSAGSGSFDWDFPSEEERERCFLVGVQLKKQRSKHGYSVQESLEELGRLADTAGLEVTGSTYQLLDEVGAASLQRIDGQANTGNPGRTANLGLARVAAACSPLRHAPRLQPLQINPRTYIGSGKVQEIMAAVAATGATTVIFDDELSPGRAFLRRPVLPTWPCKADGVLTGFDAARPWPVAGWAPVWPGLHALPAILACRPAAQP